ncbi:hypothetical protein Memar_1025 [Methanoculleus marisnigri JR1]|uniref:Uncharacterized protein n=1 Tax=Methanoculleus marisnigri (strain ATCC 35101 / DSM 1498 / JR1) TaxID=368407 RepID=A3CUA8_METMJ|nr:hypothetical protein Memar_1025 [Methanoculleus marisnigri JR1]
MLHGGTREQPLWPARFPFSPYSGTYRSVWWGKKDMFVSGSGPRRGGGRGRPWCAAAGAAGPRALRCLCPERNVMGVLYLLIPACPCAVDRGGLRTAGARDPESKLFGLLVLLPFGQSPVQDLRPSRAPALRPVASPRPSAFSCSCPSASRQSKTFGLLVLLPFGQSPVQDLRPSRAPALRPVASPRPSAFSCSCPSASRQSKTFGLLVLLPFGQSHIATHCPRPLGRGTTAGTAGV